LRDLLSWIALEVMPSDIAKAAKLTESAVVARPDNAGRIKSALSARSTSQLAWINCQLRAKRETVLGIATKPLRSQNAPKQGSARALFEVSLQETLMFWLNEA
jgi:hypothetical protein